MRCCFLICLVLGLVCGCGNLAPQITNPGLGRLVKWSEQKTASRKKIIFVHGVDIGITDPNGPAQSRLEEIWDLKMRNLNKLAQDKWNVGLSDKAEFWLYGYYPRQQIPQIADSLARQISTNKQFIGSEVFIVGYSQGGVVTWLLDQRHPDVMLGGLTLGAPMLSTPVVHQKVRDAAIKKVFPIASRLGVIKLCSGASNGTEHLQMRYPETLQPKSRLKFFAGTMPVHSANFLQRNIDVLDVAVGRGDSFFGNRPDNRQLLEIGAMIINGADWEDNDRLDHLSDGSVPVSSALLNKSSSNCVMLQGYCHDELLSGKGDFSLDKQILDWMDAVLKLLPIKYDWAPVNTGVPNLGLNNIWNNTKLASWVKFVYIKDNQLCLTDEDWKSTERLKIGGMQTSPRFSGDGQKIVWTNWDNNASNIFWLDSNGLKSITADGQSKYANWSPNNDWLVFQNGCDLVIFSLTNNKCYTIANNVDLSSPPVWINDNARGRIYFSTNNNLYWISPRKRNVEISSAVLVKSNCGSPVSIRAGGLSGVVAINTGGDETDITVVSGWLASHLSLTFENANPWFIEGNGKKFTVGLSETFVVNSAMLDTQYLHVYIVGDMMGNQGAYIFDPRQAMTSSNKDDILYEVLQGVTELDIRPAS